MVELSRRSSWVERRGAVQARQRLRQALRIRAGPKRPPRHGRGAVRRGRVHRNDARQGQDPTRSC